MVSNLQTSCLQPHLWIMYARNITHLFRQLHYVMSYCDTQAAHEPAYNNGCCLLPKKEWTSSNLYTLKRRQQVPLKYGKSPHQTTWPSFLEYLILVMYAMETSTVLCKLLSDSISTKYSVNLQFAFCHAVQNLQCYCLLCMKKYVD